MRLFIAEKPSLARALAAVLPGPQRKRSGYIECADDNVVAWCAGHILELAEPEEYRAEFRKWSMEHLPILPDQWRLSVTAPDLLKTIRGLLPRAREVVHAGDPDREGQLLVDEVLEFLGYRGPVARILISDLNPPAVRKALSQLQPNARFRGLCDSARARQRADWLYGLNLTRLYTLLGRSGGHDGVLSVGRVQTPLLGLVVRRDLEIERFTPVPFYVVTVGVRSQSGEFRATWKPPDSDAGALDQDGRLVSKVHADALVARCSDRPGRVLRCAREKKAEGPPFPYSLAELQIDAGSRFGLTAKQTLDACQALYESHRLVTYPRSDCSYLPEGQLGQAAEVLRAIVKNAPGLAALATAANPGLKSKGWADSKVTAHHAIIPTAIAHDTRGLPEAQRRIYDLVARRFVAQFYPAFEFHQTAIDIEVGGERFSASGRQPLAHGWRSVVPDVADDKDNKPHKDTADASDADEASSRVALPVLDAGAPIRTGKVTVTERRTTPPKRFTDATLVQAMTGIARFVSDPKLKQLLRESDGIGTPATQATIIQTLYDRKFIEKKGRYLTSTAIGRTLIQILPSIATTPDMTALWEAAMKKIAAGEMPLDAFLAGVVRQLTEMIARGRTQGPLAAPGAQACPAKGCTGFLRQKTTKTSRFWACTRYPDCRLTRADATAVRGIGEGILR